MYIACLDLRERGEWSVEVVNLKSTTKEKAIEELKQEIIGEWNGDEFDGGFYGADLLVDKATLFEVMTEELMPCSVWYSEADEFQENEEAKAIEESERQELARLKAKYNDK